MFSGAVRKQRRSDAGFTLIEALVAVTILVILGAFAFIGLVEHQRPMKQLELDGTAKEIFVAAQNNLTMAESQNLITASLDLGETGSTSAKWLSYPESDPDDKGTALSMMLPFASVEEYVRHGGGSYVIAYIPATGEITDVFYSDGGQFSTVLSASDADALIAVAGNEHKEDRRRFGSDAAVIGWYGSSAAPELGEELKAPSLSVVNDDVLYATVTNPNKGKQGAELDLVITGKSSKAKAVVSLHKNLEPREYTVFIDDVTGEGEHFADFISKCTVSGKFMPGEDISLQAIAQNKEKITNVARSARKTVNSLFASVSTKADGDGIARTARISSIRHLENLDEEVSKVKAEQLFLSSAEQTKDIIWSDDGYNSRLLDADEFLETVVGFKERVPAIHARHSSNGGTSLGIEMQIASSDVYITKASTSSVEPGGKYKPVDAPYLASYDGRWHSVSSISARRDGNAGLFEELHDGMELKSLKLVGASIESTGGYAGGMAGVADGASMKDLLVVDGDEPGTVSGRMAAGGLVGSAAQTDVTRCAAAVYASSSDGVAGGLVGMVSGKSDIVGSYSGGHTKDGFYLTTTSGDGRVNVSAATSAGGLIGSTGSRTSLDRCYSTCSAKGKTAGGLIGEADGTSVSGCYSTGLPIGETASPFIGKTTGSCSLSGNKYLMLTLLKGGWDSEAVDAAVAAQPDGVSQAEENLESYRSISSDASHAEAYDETLTTGYPYKTVSQLGTSTDGAPGGDEHPAKRHYGDWPAVELLVVNGKSN